MLAAVGRESRRTGPRNRAGRQQGRAHRPPARHAVQVLPPIALPWEDDPVFGTPEELIRRDDPAEGAAGTPSVAFQISRPFARSRRPPRESRRGGRRVAGRTCASTRSFGTRRKAIRRPSGLQAGEPSLRHTRVEVADARVTGGDDPDEGVVSAIADEGEPCFHRATSVSEPAEPRMRAIRSGFGVLPRARGRRCRGPARRRSASRPGERVKRSSVDQLPRRHRRRAGGARWSAPPHPSCRAGRGPLPGDSARRRERVEEALALSGVNVKARNLLAVVVSK